MTISFIELSAFSAKREQSFGDDDGFREFQNYLMVSPIAGSVVPGGGGIRKVRWHDAGRSHGKRVGLRVIYLYVPEVNVIVLFAVYDKDTTTDLTPEQRKVMTDAARVARTELRELFRGTQ